MKNILNKKPESRLAKSQHIILDSFAPRHFAKNIALPDRVAFPNFLNQNKQYLHDVSLSHCRKYLGNLTPNRDYLAIISNTLSKKRSRNTATQPNTSAAPQDFLDSRAPIFTSSFDPFRKILPEARAQIIKETGNKHALFSFQRVKGPQKGLRINKGAKWQFPIVKMPV